MSAESEPRTGGPKTVILRYKDPATIETKLRINGYPEAQIPAILKSVEETYSSGALLVEVAPTQEEFTVSAA